MHPVVPALSAPATAPPPLPPPVPIVERPLFSLVDIGLCGLLFVLLLALSPWAARGVCRLLGRERPNFRGDSIPASTGLTFLFVAAVAYGALTFLPAPAVAAPAWLFLFVSLGFGILGLVDDLWGSRAVGGFRGHLKALLRGRLTTGAVKMLGGGLVAAVAALGIDGPHHALRLVLDFLIIALSANALNLLDVRPGRAQFGFLLLCLPTVGFLAAQGWGWIALHPPAAVLLGPVVFAAAVEWWPDSRGRAMMGDVGSNLLGAVGGLAAALTLPLSGHFFLLAALLFINWLAEKVSLSELIARTPWLNAVDRQLGVR